MSKQREEKHSLKIAAQRASPPKKFTLCGVFFWAYRSIPLRLSLP